MLYHKAETEAAIEADLDGMRRSRVSFFFNFPLARKPHFSTVAYETENAIDITP
jgi:hypothetical protein